MGMLSKVKIVGSILKARLTGRSFPLVLHINVTNSCNLRCAYCYGTYDKSKSRDFTTKELFDLVDEAAAMGTRIINLGAGEPLMRKDIGELVAHIRSKDMECHMNTNGHLVPEKLDAVKKLSAVCISIDGDRPVHDSRKGAGSFDKVLAAIDLCQANNVPVHTSTMLCRDNIHTVDFIMELAMEKGFFVEFLMPFFQTTDDFIASEEQYHQALRKIIAYKKKGYPVFFSVKSHEYALNWPDYKQKSFHGELPKAAGKTIPCSAGKHMCIVDSDGKVYPCSQMIEGWDALSVFDHPFKECWDHLKKNTCHTCYAFICFNDYNLLLQLDPEVIWHHIKNSAAEMVVSRCRSKAVCSTKTCS